MILPKHGKALIVHSGCAHQKGTALLSPKKIIAVFALLVGCLTVGVAAPATAFAADAHASATPADCPTPSYGNDKDWVVITLCGSSATAIGAQSYINYYGHMEFYGPHGHIANTADTQMVNGSSYAVPINPAQSAPSGSLWCVKLWQKVTGGYHQLDNNCVTV